MSPTSDRPIRIALCDDQALVLRGLSSLLSDIGWKRPTPNACSPPCRSARWT